MHAQQRDAATVYAEGVMCGLRLAVASCEVGRVSVPPFLWGHLKRWRAELVMRSLREMEGRAVRYERSESVRELIERALDALGEEVPL